MRRKRPPFSALASAIRKLVGHFNNLNLRVELLMNAIGHYTRIIPVYVLTDFSPHQK
jgi:hypothetical protein